MKSLCLVQLRCPRCRCWSWCSRWSRESQRHLTHLDFWECILLLEFNLSSCTLSPHQTAGHVGPEVHSKLVRRDQKMVFYPDTITLLHICNFKLGRRQRHLVTSENGNGGALSRSRGTENCNSIATQWSLWHNAVLKPFILCVQNALNPFCPANNSPRQTRGEG